MCLNSPTLPFLPCFITFCSTHSYTSYFCEIFATCNLLNLNAQIAMITKQQDFSVQQVEYTLIVKQYLKHTRSNLLHAHLIHYSFVAYAESLFLLL